MQRRGTAAYGRFGGQTLLCSCNLFRAAMLVVLAVSPTPAMILVVAFLAGIGHALFFPALNAFLPRLVGGRDSAVSANTWLSLSQTACSVVGPAVGGLVVVSPGGPAAPRWPSAGTGGGRGVRGPPTGHNCFKRGVAGVPDASFFRVLGPVVALQLILMVVAIIDLVRREPERVRGPKWVWALVVVVLGFVGPVAYFIAGRKE